MLLWLLQLSINDSIRMSGCQKKSKPCLLNCHVKYRFLQFNASRFYSVQSHIIKGAVNSRSPWGIEGWTAPFMLRYLSTNGKTFMSNRPFYFMERYSVLETQYFPLFTSLSVSRSPISCFFSLPRTTKPDTRTPFFYLPFIRMCNIKDKWGNKYF